MNAPDQIKKEFMKEKLKKREDESEMSIHAIEEFKEKYGNVYEIEMQYIDAMGEEAEKAFVFKMPKAKAYDRFIKTMQKKPTRAMADLLLDGVVPEQRGELNEFLNNYPAASSSASTEYLKLLGFSDKANLRML